MIWIEVSKRDEEYLALFGLTEGTYPTIQEDTTFRAPVSEDRANSVFRLKREDGILKIGLTEKDYYDSFDEDDGPDGLDIIYASDISGKKEDETVARIDIF